MTERSLDDGRYQLGLKEPGFPLEACGNDVREIFRFYQALSTTWKIVKLTHMRSGGTKCTDNRFFRLLDPDF